MHRDSPGDETEAAPPDGPEPHRRFRRLVESSASRRLALPRLALAASLGLSAVGATLFVGSWVVRSMTAWVANQPDQQISFSKIELVPEPPEWILGRRAQILEQVRPQLPSSSMTDGNLRLLDLDLSDLTKAFLLGSPSWIKKVDRIVKHPQGLTVYLEYRKPVAVVLHPKLVENAFPIDEEGVPIRKDQIDWILEQPPFQVVGINEPLIQISRVDPRSNPVFGVQWQCVGEDGKPVGPDQMVLKAARLAEFLHRQAKTTPKGHPVPKILQILIPEGPNHPFFLKDQAQNEICWGKPPGEEDLGDPDGETRWKMWLSWLDRPSPDKSTLPYYLYFARDGVQLHYYDPRKKQ